MRFGWAAARSSLARGLVLGLLLGLLPRFGATGAEAALQVWVTDDATGVVNVIDPATAQVVATIPLPAPAKGIAFSPDRTRAYVSSVGINEVSLSVIDTATRSVLVTTPFATPDCSDSKVAVDPAGAFVYVTGGLVGNLVAVFGPTGTLVKTITGGQVDAGCSLGVAVAPGGGRVYVASLDTRVWLVDPLSGLVTPVDTGAALLGPLALSPDGNRVYAPAAPGESPSPTGSIVVLDSDGGLQPPIAISSFDAEGIVVLPGGQTLYVTDFGDGSGTAVLHVSTSQGVVNGIPVPRAPKGLALSPDATRLYAVSGGGQAGTLSVIDTTGDTVVGTVTVGVSPFDVAVLPDPCAASAATACDDGNPCTTDRCQVGVCQHVLVPDGTPCDPCDASRTCVASACTGPAYACTPSAAVAYVPGFKSNAVTFVDLASGRTSSIPVDSGPWGAAADDRGARAFVTNRRSRSLSIIDGTLRTVAATVAVGGTPLGVAADPQSGLAYVANYGQNKIDVVAPDTATRVARIAVGHGPVALAAHPAGDRLYVSNFLGNTVSVLDIATRRVLATLPVGQRPLGIAVHPDGTRLYVANYRDATVTVIGTASNRPLRTIRVGKKPFAIAIDPAGARVFVTNLTGGTISVIDATTEQLVSDVQVGPFPFGLAIDPVTHNLGVANGGSSGALSILDPATGAAIASHAVGSVPVSLGQFIGARPGDCPPGPLQCDDADPFTRDTCSATGCQHVTLDSAAGALAGIATLVDALAAAPAGSLGAGTAEIQTLVAALAAALPPSPGAADIRRARTAARAVVRALVHAARQPDVRPVVVDRLLDLARGIVRALARLRPT